MKTESFEPDEQEKMKVNEPVERKLDDLWNRRNPENMRASPAEKPPICPHPGAPTKAQIIYYYAFITIYYNVFIIVCLFRASIKIHCCAFISNYYCTLIIIINFVIMHLFLFVLLF